MIPIRYLPVNGSYLMICTAKYGDSLFDLARCAQLAVLVAHKRLSPTRGYPGKCTMRPIDSGLLLLIRFLPRPHSRSDSRSITSEAYNIWILWDR